MNLVLAYWYREFIIHLYSAILLQLGVSSFEIVMRFIVWFGIQVTIVPKHPLEPVIDLWFFLEAVYQILELDFYLSIVIHSWIIFLVDDADFSFFLIIQVWLLWLPGSINFQQPSFMSELDIQIPTAFGMLIWWTCLCTNFSNYVLKVWLVSTSFATLINGLCYILPILDPFAEANAEDSGAGSKDYVHIRIQQRNGRKSLTTVQGLRKEFSYNKILKDLKKEFCCNGTVVQDPELGQVCVSTPSMENHLFLFYLLS